MFSAIYTILLFRCDLDNLLSIASVDDGGITLGFFINVFVLMLGGLALWRSAPRERIVTISIWGPFTVISIFSLLYSPNPIWGAKTIMVTLTSASIFATAMLTARTKHPARIASLVVMASIIPILYGFVDLMSNAAVDYRVSSMFSHENIFAFFLVSVMYSVIYILSLREAGKIKGRLQYKTVFVLAAMLLIATQTRAAWAALGIVILIYAALVNRKFLLVLAFTPLILFIPKVYDRIEDVKSGFSNDISVGDIRSGAVIADSFTWRKLLWESAIRDVKEDAWFGKGVGAFRENVESFFPVVNEQMDAHSAYIQTIYETGYIGAASYIWIYLSIAALIVMCGNRRRYGLVLSFIIANMVMAYSDNVLYYISYIWYSWALMGSEVGWLMRQRRLRQMAVCQNSAEASPPKMAAF
jgi:O-antigen ligase